MNLHPSEFIAKTQAPDNNPQRIATYNMVPGTVVRLRNSIFVLVDASKGPHQWLAARTGHSLSHEQFVARMHKDPNNLPVVLFDPLDTNTGTNTDKENNNDND
jgi:hypothetical protein